MCRAAAAATRQLLIYRSELQWTPKVEVNFKHSVRWRKSGKVDKSKDNRVT